MKGMDCYHTKDVYLLPKNFVFIILITIWQTNKAGWGWLASHLILYLIN